MPHVLHQTDSGLVAAFTAADEASVRRALKQFDDRLMLDVDIDPVWQRTVWSVRCRVNLTTGESRWICDWREPNGCPLPLSHGLVEKTKNLHGDSRAPVLDVTAANDQHRLQIRREIEEEALADARDLVKRLKGWGGPVLPRGRYRRNTRFREVTDVR